jgi:hypothetical protein
MHLLATRFIILVMLIACALCVTGLSTIEVLERRELSWLPDSMNVDIGRAGAELGTLVCM